MKINCFHKLFNFNLTNSLLVYLGETPGKTPSTVVNKEELRIQQLLLSQSKDLKNTLLKIPGADPLKTIRVEIGGVPYIFFLDKNKNQFAFLYIGKKQPVLNSSGNKTGRVFYMVESYSFNLITCKYIGGKAQRAEDNEIGFSRRTATNIEPRLDLKQISQLLVTLLPELKREVEKERREAGKN